MRIPDLCLFGQYPIMVTGADPGFQHGQANHSCWLVKGISIGGSPIAGWFTEWKMKITIHWNGGFRVTTILGNLDIYIYNVYNVYIYMHYVSLHPSDISIKLPSSMFFADQCPYPRSHIPGYCWWYPQHIPNISPWYPICLIYPLVN